MNLTVFFQYNIFSTRLNMVIFFFITIVKGKSFATLTYAGLLSFERDKNNTAY